MIGKGNDRRRLKKPVKIGAVIVSMVLALFVGAGIFSNRLVKVDAAEGVKIVDQDTTNNWQNVISPDGELSTQNVGRIWTDKSVFSEAYSFSGDSPLGGNSVEKDQNSDFLVALSALGSTSNLTYTTTTVTPLDIVLVVDTSGSMDNDNGYDMGYLYTAVYRLSNNRSYYIQVDGEWTRVTHNNEGWYYGNWNNRTYVTPKTNENDSADDRYQFYTRSNDQLSRMEALQNAANQFVDSVAVMNDSVTDVSQRHRIALVKFASDENNAIGNGTNSSGYNYSQVVSDLASYTTENASTLKSTINSLYGEGATQADYGLHQAQRVFAGEGSLTGARDEAQKVVIFFTDGNPTSYQSFDDEVAGSAIDYAYQLKQENTLIYSIGVFSGADPSDVNGDFNKYMNAVSSNYPDAQCVNFWGNQSGDFADLNLGNRIKGENGEADPQYYFAASNADELDQVFENITESLPGMTGSGSPIEEVTQQGGHGTPGYLTFTDTLGNYMQISGDTMSLAYGDTIYTSENGVTSEGVTTYAFSGSVEGNAVYAEADLSDIEITVAHGSDLAAGDTVTVRIPASLIPLRNYQVDTDNNTMSVSSAYPIRLFYNVSLKEGAKAALNNPQDENYGALIASQTSSDKKTIDFYSNSFAQGNAAGSTTATFTPSDGNKFYYFTENTTLYSDENLTLPATQSDVQTADMLYFKDIYWSQGDTTATEGTYAVSISRSTQLWNEIVYNASNQAYIPAGTHRTQRPGTLTQEKVTNDTATAGNVLTPAWGEGELFVVSLGNNGKLSFAAPGELEIKKTVDWGNASDTTKQNKNNFTFTVNLLDAGGTELTAEYLYSVYGKGEDPVSSGTVKNGGTITISADQRAVISGLPAGTLYTVTENGANQNGFTTADSSAGESANTADGIVEGTIVAGSQQSVSFINTYHAEAVNLSTKATLSAEKILEGREWRDTDSFEFTIEGSNAETPMPGELSITADSENPTISFGDITYEKPGEYRYRIFEENDSNPIAGIDYSAAAYRVIVTVTDNGQGALQVSDVIVEKQKNDAGEELDPVENVEGTTAVFTNTYDVSTGTTNIDGVKSYNDTTGGNGIEDGDFTFRIEALGGFETAGGSADNYTVVAVDVPMPAGATGVTKTVTNTGNGFGFGQISYDGNDVGKTFAYSVSEVAGSESGMTYDAAVHMVYVQVDEVTDGDGTYIVPVVLGDYANPSNLVFNNTYDPDDVVLSGDTAIHGTKTLNGRGLLDGEKFYFTLSAVSDNAKEVLPNSQTVSIESLTNGSADFRFDDLIFSKVGTYTFKVDETMEDGSDTTDGNGLTYSKNVCTVTVTVTDNGQGSLETSVNYANQGSSEAGKAVFTNDYTSNMNYGAEGAGGIRITKQMIDRPMAANEFAFSIVGVDSATVDADTATAKLSAADQSFQNTPAAMNQMAEMPKLQNLTFNQDDAGKTYSYLVSETIPADAEKLSAVVYDQTQYKVDIEVFDDGDGTMHTLTTVTKVKDASGSDIAAGTEGSVIIDKRDSSAEGYEAPVFGFVNDYDPQPAVISEDAGNPLQVNKTVVGAPSPDGTQYTFTLTAGGSNTDHIVGLDSEHKATATTTGVIQDGETQTLSFGELKFTEPGNYTFTVQENVPAEDAGWTFDSSVQTITVTVSSLNEQNQYDGSLHVTNVTGNPASFTNSYAAGPVTLSGSSALTVQKTVTGYDTSADFTFKIEPADGEDPKWQYVSKENESWDGTVTITNDLTAGVPEKAVFEGITFSAEGVYTFKVTETAGEDVPAGWTYDAHEAFVTVTVTDTDYDGSLEAAVSYDNSDAHTDADKAVTDASAFTNSYTAAPVTLTADGNLCGTKQLNGRNGLTDETFGFTLSKGSVAEGADWSAVTVQSADSQMAAFESDSAEANLAATNEATFTFSDLTFSKAGTYVFHVNETSHNGAALSELSAEPVNGMRYDRHTGIITVTVTDDGSGQLSASAAAGTMDDDKTVFVNSYAPTPVTYGAGQELLGGHKFIDDNTGSYTLSANTFEFVMRAQNSSNPMPEGLAVTQDSQGRSIVTVMNSQQNGAVYDFGEIIFTHDDMTGAQDNGDGTFTKTFQYNLFEGDTDLAGITKDNSAYTVTFTVTEDQNKGEMSVSASAVKITAGSGSNVSVGMDQLDFTNTYNAAQVTGYQNIFKTMVGRNWNSSDKYTFNIEMKATELDGQTPLASSDLPELDGTNAGGTVSQTVPNADGDGYSWTVIIEPRNTEVPNSYRFNTGELQYAHVGIYTYTITESPSEVANVTADTAEYTVTVTITDENGVLKRTAEISPSPAASGTLDFTNTYVPTPSDDIPTDFELNKVFTGHEWTEDYAFEFVLSPVDGAPMPLEDTNAGITIDGEGNAHRTISGPDAGNTDTAGFNFGAIHYDTAGTYRYEVTETAGSHGGVKYDDHKAEITVSVTDVNGQLVASASVTNGTFWNSYSASADYNAAGTGGLAITKVLSNRSMAADQFSFTITATGENAEAAAEKLGIADGLSVDVKNTGAPAGMAASVQTNPFDTVTFDETEDGVSYTYTIQENGVSGEGEYAGYVLDSSIYTVTITPSDNGDGTMNVTTSVDDRDDGHDVAAVTNQRVTVPFENRYEADPAVLGAEGDASIRADKTLKNDDIAGYAGQFSFAVMSGNTQIATGTNAADGTIIFSDITYTTENLAAAVNGGSDVVGEATLDASGENDVYTFHYTVAELADSLSEGVTANKAQEAVTVTVTDDRHGVLAIAVAYEDGDSADFINTYGADAEYALTLSGNKVITGDTGLNIPVLADGTFTFTVTGNAASDGTPAPMPAETSVTNQSGAVSFGPIVYTMENVFGAADGDSSEGPEMMTVGRTKVFTYTIAETGGSMDGVTNDASVKTVEVTVTDEGDGKLSAAVTAADPDADGENHFTFRNVYSVTPENSSLTGDGGFAVTKKLLSNTDRALAEGEFTFRLLNTDGSVAAEAVNAADGTVSVPALTFTKPGIYSYLLEEAEASIPGIAFDNTVYNVSAEVTDNGDGTLSVRWTVPQAEENTVIFENTYTASATDVSIGAGKVLNGRDLAEGEFTFLLKDESGNLVSSAVNTENGSIRFDRIEFTEPGTYVYTVSEEVGENPDITYDDTVFTVTVNVTDDRAGHLKSSLSIAEGDQETDSIVFENTYTEPEKPAETPKPEEPVTGNWNSPVPYAAAITLSLAGIAAILIKRMH